MTGISPVPGLNQVMPGQVLDQVMKAVLREIPADSWDWLPADQTAEVLP